MELIVVVVIIGILSAIAVPSFNNASDKAKQKEASVLLASYVKAAQAYYTEYSTIPTTATHLREYITIFACAVADPSRCQTPSAIALYRPSDGNQWISASGLYSINMITAGQQVQSTANPAGSYLGYGVGGCFSSQNGFTRVVESATKGDVVPPDCN